MAELHAMHKLGLIIHLSLQHRATCSIWSAQIACFNTMETSLVLLSFRFETTSNMASMEEDFPRGGPAKKLTESKTKVERTEVDNLFQVEV